MDSKTIPLVILGVVAILAIVGLILLYTGSKSGMVVQPYYRAGGLGTFENMAEGNKYQRAGDAWRFPHYDPDGPRYYSEGEARIIGDYADARYSGQLPGGGSYNR